MARRGTNGGWGDKILEKGNKKWEERSDGRENRIKKAHYEI